MVVIASAITNKIGKGMTFMHLLSALVSRQFVEISRGRIEGLLGAFPKLMGTEKQHTFIETDQVLVLID